MLDKCDLEAPRGISFTPEFARAFGNPKNDTLFKKSGGGLYLVKADLRGAGIPAMLSLGHKHHPKLGPKFELLGAGEMHYSDFVSWYEQVFKGDADDASILRVDMTADVRDVRVDELGCMIWGRHKHTNIQHYGEEPTSSYNRFGAQTLYWGRKPRQLRIYDKTLERAQVILRNLHRFEKKNGLPLSSFEQAFGYAITQIVTRVERQMGARETAEKWGVAKFGQIHELVNYDPFDNLQFAEGDGVLTSIEGTQLGTILMLRERVDRDGLDRTRAWWRSLYKRKNASDSFRKFWKKNGHLIVVACPSVTRDSLAAEQKRTLIAQLAA